MDYNIRSVGYGTYYGVSAGTGGVSADEKDGSFHLEMDNKLSAFYIIFNVFVLVYNIITYN